MRNSPTPEIPLRRSPAPAPRQLSALALAAGFALAAPHARVQAQTVLPEVQITTAAVPDFEFDSARRGRFCASCNFGSGNARLSFTDSSGNLWLGGVDYATGDFIPANGRGQLLDTATPPVPCFGNGPEWMASTAGSQIVYTRFVDGSGFPGDGTYSCTASPPQLAVATQTASGWTTAVLPNSLNRATPEGSTDETDSDPRINYIENGKTALYWRRLAAPTVETPIPISDLTGGNSRRWVLGTRQIVFQGHRESDPRLLDQVWLVDTDTGVREELTKDSVTKAGAFMWRAPEYNNEYVFFTMANFRKEIWVYRNLKGPKNTRLWTIVKKIKAPPIAPFFWSPEVFTHNGRSYIFTQISPDANFFNRRSQTHIAITSIDPLRNDFRMLTNDFQRPRVRLDPEFFITAKGPFIYYNRIVPATDEYPDGINDGVWRVDTGLGPPKF